jgi:hypothetical protein
MQVTPPINAWKYSNLNAGGDMMNNILIKIEESFKFKKPSNREKYIFYGNGNLDIASSLDVAEEFDNCITENDEIEVIYRNGGDLFFRLSPEAIAYFFPKILKAIISDRNKADVLIFSLYNFLVNKDAHLENRTDFLNKLTYEQKKLVDNLATILADEPFVKEYRKT